MATSEQLRKNKKQHKPKNVESKRDDKEIFKAMDKCAQYLRGKFKKELNENKLRLEIQRKISYRLMMAVIRSKGLRREFDAVFDTQGRTIRPDGGVIMLTGEDEAAAPRIVLVSEAKKQGTNEARAREGQPRQSRGNAIERLGKNLTGIKAMMNHEHITPFVCFGWGCDFKGRYARESEADFVMAKLSMLNEFYKLNKVWVYKRDGDNTKNRYAPVSMYFRERPWTQREMLKILREVGEDAMRYYLH